ncbi:MAG: hypothetical protein ABW328_21830 [Ilumatobacteraceae bacterium]
MSSQPAALDGDAKRIQLLTLAALRESAIAAGVTDDAEVDTILVALDALARRPDSVVSTAQIVQSWGRRIA